MPARAKAASDAGPMFGMVVIGVGMLRPKIFWTSYCLANSVQANFAGQGPKFAWVDANLDGCPIPKNSLALLLAGGRILTLLLRRGGSARLLGRLRGRFGHRAAPLGLALLIEMRRERTVTHLFQNESNPLKRQGRGEI